MQTLEYIKYQCLALYRSQYLFAIVQYSVYAALATLLYTTKVGDGMGEMIRIGFVALLPSISLTQAGANVFGWMFRGFVLFHIAPQRALRFRFYLILPTVVFLLTMLICLVIFAIAKFPTYEVHYKYLFLMSILSGSLAGMYMYAWSLLNNVSPIKQSAFSFTIQKAEARSGFSNVLAALASIALVEALFYFFAEHYWWVWFFCISIYLLALCFLIAQKLAQMLLNLYLRRFPMYQKMSA